MGNKIIKRTIMNPTGEIFSGLVDRELGAACPKCNNSEMCIMPNEDVAPRKDDTIESFVEFWERYVNDPTLIKKELFLHCHKCNGSH